MRLAQRLAIPFFIYRAAVLNADDMVNFGCWPIASLIRLAQWLSRQDP